MAFSTHLIVSSRLNDCDADSLQIRAEDNGFIIECNDIPPPMQETTPQPSTPSARSNATTFAVNNVSESLPANGSAIKSPDEMHQQSSEREQLQNDSESQSREAEQADGAEST
jgi:hypothetical protein